MAATPEPASVADSAIVTGEPSAVPGQVAPLQVIVVVGGVVSGGGGGGGAFTSASRIVFTTVPFADRGFSQSKKALRSEADTDSSSHRLQMSWNRNGTQPPPSFSAWVTHCFIIGSVMEPVTAGVERIAH